MMYPRLELLRDLLSEHGSIWFAIDDNERHYLKVMMDDASIKTAKFEPRGGIGFGTICIGVP